MHENRQSF